MEIINEFRLTVDSKSINEAFCRGVTACFAAQLDPTIEELADIKTAVSEAVTNAIVHGYGERCGKIYIDGIIDSSNNIVIKIGDKGRGIENIQLARSRYIQRVTENARDSVLP